MERPIIFLFGLFLGVIIGWFLKPCGTADENSRKKLENKRKILAMFETRKRVANNQVEKRLGVSDATAERYLEELEREGKIKQVGRTGRAVYYQKTK